VVTHIEENPPFVENRALYLRCREGLVAMATRLKEMGYTLNFQSDWRFLAAIKQHDDGEVTRGTNGKNVLRWLKEDMGFEIDPHAHESTHNYADVAYLIEQLGVKPSGVAGGFLYGPLDQTLQPWWDRMREPIRGWKYPNYEWRCQILWGAGTATHSGEEYYISGLWRPKSREEYFTNDPKGNLISHGHWRIAKDVIDLVDKMRRGDLQPADGMFTAAIGAGQRNLMVGSEDQKHLFQELDLLVPYTRAGAIRWAGLTQQVEIWKNRYGEKPTFYKIPFTRPVGTGLKGKSKLCARVTPRGSLPDRENRRHSRPPMCPA
jgi:hypothetical protein